MHCESVLQSGVVYKEHLYTFPPSLFKPTRHSNAPTPHGAQPTAHRLVYYLRSPTETLQNVLAPDLVPSDFVIKSARPVGRRTLRMPPATPEESSPSRAACCSFCDQVILGDVHMLADRAYCSITHRRSAFDRLRWDHGQLLPVSQNSAENAAPQQAHATSAAAPETVARRLAAVSIKASISRSASLVAAEDSLEAACTGMTAAA